MLSSILNYTQQIEKHWYTTFICLPGCKSYTGLSFHFGTDFYSSCCFDLTLISTLTRLTNIYIILYSSYVNIHSVLIGYHHLHDPK